MALYEGLRRSSQEADAGEWRSLRHGPEKHAKRPGFLEGMLGLKPGTAKARPVAAPRREEWQRAKVRAVGSGTSVHPRGRKGVGRLLLVVALTAWGVSRFRPRSEAVPAKSEVKAPVENVAAVARRPWMADLKQLFHLSTDAELAAEAKRNDEAGRAQAAKEKAALAALPVDPAGGDAVALWQDGNGRWWQVNEKAELRSSAGPADKSSLGLPELRGLSAMATEHAHGKRLRLQMPDGLLKKLLPLEPSVASEVRALLLDDAEHPALLTHGGTRCLLDAKDWERRQQRLGLVLADLAARKRRASLIDLRYEDTAVVRPAGRG